jgi:hypothetical protein
MRGRRIRMRGGIREEGEKDERIRDDERREGGRG